MDGAAVFLTSSAEEAPPVLLHHVSRSNYLGRETILATGKGKMDKVSETLFGFLSRNATGATAFFNLPPERVVELGMQLDL